MSLTSMASTTGNPLDSFISAVQSVDGQFTGGSVGTTATDSTFSTGNSSAQAPLSKTSSSTPSPQPSQSTLPNSSNQSSPGLSEGAKIGIGVGASLGLLMLLMLCFFLWRWDRRQRWRMTRLKEETSKGEKDRNETNGSNLYLQRKGELDAEQTKYGLGASELPPEMDASERHELEVKG